MNKSISGEFRLEFEAMFAACATANPRIALKDREQCQKALDLVEAVVRGEMSRGVPTYIDDDELIQECLIRLPGAIRDYTGKNGASPKTYLKHVIHNDVTDAIKRLKREHGNDAPPLRGERESAKYGLTKDGLLNEYGQRISQNDAALALSREKSDQSARDRQRHPEGLLVTVEALLTPEQFQAVILCDVEGVTQEQAAERLGTTRTAIASRLRKAHATLRKKVFGDRYQFPDYSSLRR